MLDAPRASNVEAAELVDVPAVHEVRAAAGAEAPVLDDGSAARRTKSMAGRVFKDEFGMMWLIVGDDLGEFVDALDQDGKERRVTVLALRKLVATQGDGRWLTKSLDETESAFKGRYQPKAWRGALPSLRLRDLSAGE